MLNLSIIRNSRQITQRIKEVLDRTVDLRPLLLEIGEDMEKSTKVRFRTLQNSDGIGWQANSALWLIRYKKMSCHRLGKKAVNGTPQFIADGFKLRPFMSDRVKVW